MRKRYFPLVIAILGAVLALGSLHVGLQFDDFYQRWVIQGSPVFTDVGRKPLDAFSFADGDPQRNRRMMEIGLFAWWTDPALKAAFWRPMTVVTHMIDHWLWPGMPSLMHVQSIFWFAMMILSACLLYRRVMRSTVPAGIAGLLFAFDHSHAIPAAWLANRNSILAGLFGILAIYAHVKSRRDARGVEIASPILLAMSLLSAEAGLGAVAYLVAYALVLDRSGWRSGLAKLWPHALVAIAWRIAWIAQGYGVNAMEDLYFDPAADPLRFARFAIERAPLYLFGQWSGFPVEIFLALPRGTATKWWIGLVVLGVIAIAFIPLLRRSRIARFWGLGMLLATAPICAAVPMNRNLIFVGLGAMGLLGQFLAAALGAKFWRRPLLWRACQGVLVGALAVIHLVIAPVGLAVLARFPCGPDPMLDAFQTLPVVPRSDRDMIFVNFSWSMHMLDLLTARAVDGEPLPRSAQILAPASTEVTVTRTDENTLLVRPDRGYFVYLASGMGYSRDSPLAPGRTIDLKTMKITITETTADGRPAAVLFRFNTPLEDQSLQWICWKSGRFQEFQPPPVGSTVSLPASGLPF
jgi:hypothetical protein